MSFGGISILRLVDHLPPDVIVTLLAGAFHALVPEGILIAEAENPHNLRVGTAGFYVDPTRLRPVPPEYLEWLMIDLGFADVTVQHFDPGRPPFHLSDDDGLPIELVSLAARVHAALDGPRRYTISGRRPL